VSTFGQQENGRAEIASQAEGGAVEVSTSEIDLPRPVEDSVKEEDSRFEFAYQRYLDPYKHSASHGGDLR